MTRQIVHNEYGGSLEIYHGDLNDRERAAIRALAESRTETYIGARRKVHQSGVDSNRTGVCMFLAELERQKIAASH